MRFKTRLIAFAGLVILACLSRALQAAEVTVELVDGRRVTGEWLGWTADGPRLRTADVETTVPLADVHAAAFQVYASTNAPATDGGVRVDFTDGGCAFGRLTPAAPGSVGIERPDGLQMTIPFEHVAAIQLQQRRDCPAGDDALQDTLRAPAPGRDLLIACDLGDVKCVGGVLESIGPDSGSLRYEGRVRTFPTARLFALVLARSGTVQQAAPALITVADGSVYPATIESSDATALQLRLPFHPSLTVPLDQVVAIRWRNERVVALSSWSPSVEHIDGVVHRPWPWRRDRGAANGPIRLGGREYSAGIGVHARTELTFAINAEYDSFYAVIGVDDHARPRGSVVFKVLTDGAAAFDSGLLTGRDAPREVRVPLKGVRELTLVVEDGGDLDLSDEADWADARLVRPASDSR